MRIRSQVRFGAEAEIKDARCDRKRSMVEEAAAKDQRQRHDASLQHKKWLRASISEANTGGGVGEEGGGSDDKGGEDGGDEIQAPSGENSQDC